ncbi:hypothetical protein [uncultured Clostridium sp.]|nr:hypothetical protein [uncultured Clostridium sp.]
MLPPIITQDYCGLCMIAIGIILLAIIWAYNDAKRPINPLK